MEPLEVNTAASAAKFLYECIWCRYGCPIELISDQGGHLRSRQTTPYYPQANGLAESTNKRSMHYDGRRAKGQACTQKSGNECGHVQDILDASLLAIFPEWDAECRLRSLCSRVDPAFVSRETTLGATESTNHACSELEVLAEFVESKSIIEFALCLITKSPP